MNIESTPKRIAIFRAGDLVASDGRAISFSVSDLQDIATGYDPALAKAPLVVGHPKTDDPAFGWATGLAVEGDTLMADVDQVEVQFAAMVNDGRFPNRSAEIFLPSSPGNPKPGRYYLKHIGFLGAAAPAVTGLPPVRFASGSDTVTFAFSAVPTLEPIMDPQNPTAKPTPAAPNNPAAVDPVTFAAQAATKQAELDRREQQVAERERQIAADALAAERSAAVSFAASLVSAGKVLPAQQDAVVELIIALPGNDAPVQFAQGTSTVSRPARELLREVLEGMPTRIDYREKAGGQDNAPAVSFAAPSGAQVDAGRADQYTRIKALQATNPNMTVVEAARLVGA